MDVLLDAVVEIGSDLDLDATLRRVIAASKRLTGARYGGLGVRAADGAIGEFFHDGIDAATVGLIGHPPVGKGLLGLPLYRPEALRTDNVADHAAAVGFPEHHPQMRAFLGVPITIRGKVFGSIYLTDDRPEFGFSQSDEIAVRALASAAGVAIDNARLFERLRSSAKWTRASREITTALLSGIDPQVRALRLIAEHARELTGAEQAIVLVPEFPDEPVAEVRTLRVSTAVGVHEAEVIGQRIPVAGSTSGAVFRSGTPVITDSFRHPIPGFTDVGERPAIVMPLRAQHSVVGVIAVARNAHQPAFDTVHMRLMGDFADHAAMAITLASAHEHARDLTILADRERIAHDLHDHVIQRLFAAGIDLQGTIARSGSSEVNSRLTRTVDSLQSVIDEIRTAIFNLQNVGGAEGGTLRQRIQLTLADLTENSSLATTLRVVGPMTAVGAELANHAEAVVTEAVSNTVRHAGAGTLVVDITVADELSIEITDDGRGIPATTERRSGLANIAKRAEQASGRCQFETPPQGGTKISWSAPLF
ncbi:MAG: GAF domain-containing protein [Candidatus Sericytochromatia bacterium]